MIALSRQQKLAGKAAKAQEKAEAAKDLAIEKAHEAGFEPQGLEPQAVDEMPHRKDYGLIHGRRHKRYQCRSCRHQATLTAGTILEAT